MREKMPTRNMGKGQTDSTPGSEDCKERGVTDELFCMILLI